MLQVGNSLITEHQMPCFRCGSPFFSNRTSKSPLSINNQWSTNFWTIYKWTLLTGLPRHRWRWRAKRLYWNCVRLAWWADFATGGVRNCWMCRLERRALMERLCELVTVVPDCTLLWLNFSPSDANLSFRFRVLWVSAPLLNYQY